MVHTFLLLEVLKVNSYGSPVYILVVDVPSVSQV